MGSNEMELASARPAGRSVGLAMGRIANLYRTSVGKKIVMAVTGLVLLAFVIGHMLGNLKIYFGPDEYNQYARYLRDFGTPLMPHTFALWGARIILLAAVGLHITAAIQLTRQSRQARTAPYHVQERLAFSYASYTMRWGGVVILAFVIYHLLHLTFGTVHPSFDHDSVYHNVVAGFRRWPAAIAYIVAMIPLGMHIYHGLWSAFQTLGINHPRYNGWRRPTALAIALIIVIGNISIPIAVLSGIVPDATK